MRNLRTTIIDTICRTMPETAARSGFCSVVDQSQLIESACERLFHAWRVWVWTQDAAGLPSGFTAFQQWLCDRGEIVGESRAFSKQLQERLILEGLRNGGV